MRGLALVVLLCLALAAPGAHAQVELDGSIGPASGLVPGGTLPDGSTATYLIEESYGRRSGPNLFHSFSRFNVPGFSSAVFTGDPSIQRVVGRVTSGAPSEINGAIRNTIEGADLYLLNPRGFLISTTASLDLRGSLYLSSANNLRFADGGEFSTIPSSGEVLSFAAPRAWGFTSTSSTPTIRINQVRNFGVPSGETLEVVGGSVIVAGAPQPTTPLTPTLLAPGGTIALASRTTPGEVPVGVASLSARDAAAGELGSITISSTALLDVADPSDLSPTRGRIVIRGGSLTVTSSTLRTDSAVNATADQPDIDLETTRSIVLGTPSNPSLPSRVAAIEVATRGGASGGALRLSSGEISLASASRATTSASDSARAGSLVVNAGSFRLMNFSSVRSTATDESDGGDLRLTAETIELSALSNVATAASGAATGGSLEVSAGSLFLSGISGIQTDAADVSVGGALQLSAEEMELSGASTVATAASGAARAGALDVEADSVLLSEESRFATGATGDATAGRVDVTSRDLRLGGAAQIRSLNEASTDAPEIAISATELLRLDSGASVTTETNAVGRGAAVRIDATTLEQATGAKVDSGTRGTGVGGNLEIHASRIELGGDSQAAEPGGVLASSFGSAPAGGIFIAADDVTVAGGAQISATAEGRGRGGDVEIAISRRLELSGAGVVGPSGVFARAGLTPGTTATGSGGSIQIEAPVVVLSDGAEISAQTYGSGAAGSVRVVAADSVTLVGGDLLTSSINAKAGAGSGGSIAIETAELRVNGGGQISTSALDTGDSGSIEIEAQRVYVGGTAPIGAAPAGVFAQSIPTQDSGIAGGRGGDIEIRAANLVSLQDGGVISAESRGPGEAGSVRIVAPTVTVSDGAEVSTQAFGGGDAGDVAIHGARSLRVEGGTVSARSTGVGAAGSVTLNGVGELIVGEGGSITSEAVGEGAGGSIAIDARSQVLVMNGGTISALSTGVGDAGNITINAGQRFSARNGGQVTTSAVAADGGDILIGASRLIYIQDGKVTTDVRAGTGSGGNITLDPEFVVLNRAELRASATGDGGNITIQTDRFVRDASSIVDASSEFGVDGEIQTTSPTVDLTSELAQLDTTFLDASSKLAAVCAARSGERGTFAVRAHARASSPDAPLDSEAPSESPLDCRQFRTQP